MKKINSSCMRDRSLSYKRAPKSLIQLIAVSLAALVTMSALIFIIAYILIKGIPYLTPDLFAWEYNSDNVYLMPALINTLLMSLAIMILPMIMRSTEEALLAVPDSYREGSFGLGAGRLRTVFRIVLPPAVPGILSGIILGMGRIVGESAALIFTAGTVAEAAKSIFSSARTLSVHMYVISGEGLYINQAYATAVVLLVVVIILNALSSFAAKKLGGKNSNG